MTFKNIRFSANFEILMWNTYLGLFIASLLKTALIIQIVSVALWMQWSYSIKTHSLVTCCWLMKEFLLIGCQGTSKPHNWFWRYRRWQNTVWTKFLLPNKNYKCVWVNFESIHAITKILNTDFYINNFYFLIFYNYNVDRWLH